MVVTLRDAYVSGGWGMAFDCKVSYFAGGCRASAASFPSQKLGSSAVELADVVVLVQFWGYGNSPTLTLHNFVSFTYCCGY